jgi:transposase-like protein
MTADLTNPVFTDEDKAREWLEAQRWANGVFCPACGQFDTVSPFKGKSMGAGWYHCNSCRRKFTVRVGTLYERSHIPLHKWLLATHLLASSKKGMSAHQLHRMLGITYKSAWFMAHRIREGMKDDISSGPLGGPGTIVEVDEAYFGKRENPAPLKKRQTPYTKRGKSGPAGKRVIIGLVERGGRFAPSTSTMRAPPASARSSSPTCRAKACCILTKRVCMSSSDASSKATAPCIMPAANMPVTKLGSWSRPTPSKMCSQCSSAA